MGIIVLENFENDDTNPDAEVNEIIGGELEGHEIKVGKKLKFSTGTETSPVTNIGQLQDNQGYMITTGEDVYYFNPENNRNIDGTKAAIKEKPKLETDYPRSAGTYYINPEIVKDADRINGTIEKKQKPEMVENLTDEDKIQDYARKIDSALAIINDKKTNSEDKEVAKNGLDLMKKFLENTKGLSDVTKKEFLEKINLALPIKEFEDEGVISKPKEKSTNAAEFTQVIVPDESSKEAEKDNRAEMNEKELRDKKIIATESMISYLSVKKAEGYSTVGFEKILDILKKYEKVNEYDIPAEEYEQQCNELMDSIKYINEEEFPNSSRILSRYFKNEDSLLSLGRTEQASRIGMMFDRVISSAEKDESTLEEAA